MAILEWNSPIPQQERAKAKTELLKLRDKLNKIKSNHKLVYIPEIKFTHGGNQFKNVYKDVFIYTPSDTSYSDILVIFGIGDYRLHADLDHYNVQPSHNTYDLPSGEEIHGARLCIPIKGNLLHEMDETTFGKLFTAQFTQGNGNDKYRRIYYTTSEGDEKFQVGEIPRASKNLEAYKLILGYEPSPYDSPRRKSRINEKIIELKKGIDDANNTWCVKFKRSMFYILVPDDVYYEALELNQISEYYPKFTISQAKEIINTFADSKTEVDIACCGLGSAGSGIMEQVCRLDYFDKFLLIDYDRVERKNLINQTYSSNHIGGSKVSAMDEIIRTTHDRITNHSSTILIDCKKFQDSFLSGTKGKYIISGFDSTSARLDLLKGIKDKTYEYKYLIDVRYVDKDASVWFVDTDNPQELELYSQQLEQDAELIKHNGGERNYNWTTEQVKEFMERHNVGNGGCCQTIKRYFEHDCIDCLGIECSGGACIEHWKQALIKQNVPVDIDLQENNNTCLHYNLIPIYKVASAYISTGIIEIETNDTKPFTWVEVTCDGMVNARKVA